MAGTTSDIRQLAWALPAFSSAAVTAGQVLAEVPVMAEGFIGGIRVHAQTAGTGTGDTVIDILRNGRSIWSSASSRPFLAATSTGEFTNREPDVRHLAPGDLLTVQVASISTTGHARLGVTIGIERP